MMIEQIIEPVDALASFSGGQIRPRAFLWNERRYNVDRVNLAYDARDGRDVIRYFVVTCGPNSFKLSFHPGEMSWNLLEIYGEG
jgi:hypothetical protein